MCVIVDTLVTKTKEFTFTTPGPMIPEYEKKIKKK